MMVCLICGSSISNSNDRKRSSSSKQDKTLSHIEKEILTSWKNECATATCQVLFEDKSDCFVDYFQNADYCSCCEQVVRDLGFTWKQIQTFQNQILQLSKKICNLLISNYQKIETKSDTTLVHSRMSYLLDKDGPLPFSIYSWQEMLEIIYSVISNQEDVHSHSDGSPLYATKKIQLIRTSSQMKTTLEEQKSPESLQRRIYTKPDKNSDAQNSRQEISQDFSQSPNKPIENVFIKTEVKSEPENDWQENCSGESDGSAMEDFYREKFGNPDIIHSDVDDNASENSVSSLLSLSAKTKRKIKIPSTDSVNQKKSELKDPTESDEPQNETSLFPICCTEDNCNSYFATVQKMQIHANTVHKGETSYSCTLCPKRYKHNKNLRNHILNVHEKAKIYPSCSFCEKRFENRDDLTMHYSNSHQEPNPFHCAFCTAIFENREHLIGHTNKYHPKLHKDRNKMLSCPQCQKKCDSERGLQSHIQLVHEKEKIMTKHPCKFCGKNYGTQEEITLHYSNAHQEPSPFQCAFCPEIFTNEKDLKEHTKSSHSEPDIPLKYKCEICDNHFSDEQILKIHLLENHEGGRNLTSTYTCLLCEMTFDSHNLLKLHGMEKHESELKCDMCGKLYPTYSRLTSHMNESHTIKNYKCNFCDTIIVGFKLQLRKHQLMHNKILAAKLKETKVSYECKFCSRSYKKEDELNLHYSESHQGPNPFCCAFCPEIFTNSVDLRKHTKFEHPNPEDMAERVKCDVCSRYFSNEAILRRHKSLYHRELGVIKCSACCIPFPNPESLKRHMEAIHSNDEPSSWVCETCGKSFKNRRQLKQHTKIHDGTAKKVNCKICDKVFSKTDACKQHERTHTDIKEFVCHLCGRGHNNYGSLYAHIKRHTGDTSLSRKRKPK